uniref:Uncharacterized protein n=1 Tax=Aegilops tauschii subsp. strangulata TaxID=200361 RepID=A0A453K592_AEGTS
MMAVFFPIIRACMSRAPTMFEAICCTIPWAKDRNDVVSPLRNSITDRQNTLSYLSY